MLQWLEKGRTETHVVNFLQKDIDNARNGKAKVDHQAVYFETVQNRVVSKS